MAEPHDRKPILTIEQQIEHLKQKGVAFELCSEEEAADYLRDKCNFFKLASYRKLFSKYEGGPRDGRYVDLDFGQLRLLAALDQELRHALLGMTLDIEHFQKVTLLREMEDRRWESASRSERGFRDVLSASHSFGNCIPFRTRIPGCTFRLSCHWESISHSTARFRVAVSA